VRNDRDLAGGALVGRLAQGRGAAIAGLLDPVLAAMREVARTLAAHLPPSSAHARRASCPG
jgi:hypothetical protein